MASGGGTQAPQFDANAAANRQTTANIDTGVANAYMGNTNQVTPYGTLNYDQTGTQNVGGHVIPQFTATQRLSPEQQHIYDQTTGLQSGALDTAGHVVGQVNSAVQQPLDFSHLNQLPTDQTQLRNDAYGALTARSTEDLNRQTQQTQTQLANQGIAPGTEAYNNAMMPLERARVDASNQATINSGNIAGQNLQQGQTLRNQGIQELLQQRNQPMQDYQALLGFGGGVQQPNWATPTQASIQTPDVTSPYVAQYQGQMNAYNQQLQQQNAMMGGMFGLGGSVLGGLAMAGGRKMFA